MQEGQNMGVNNNITENREGGEELRLTEGRFSSQNTGDAYNGGSVNSNINNGFVYANASNTANANTNAGNTNTNIGNANANANQMNGYYGSAGNDYRYAQGTWQNAGYGQSAGRYQYGNTYPDDYGKAEKEKKKKENNGGGYFKKALACVSLGLLFGICAGLGWYAVDALTGMSDNEAVEPEAVISQDAVVDSSNAILEKADEIIDESEEVISNSVNETEIEKTQTVTTVVSDVSDMVASVMPAVVSINNVYTERISYFGQTFTSEAQASGSGIIVGENDEELLIVTNYHVVADADKLSVVFAEGSEIEAAVKGMDMDMDLAVISVPLENIRTSTLNRIAIATLGDSDALKVGEPAIAIGNALGYGQSVTTGCISALNRDMELEDGSIGTFIQTDAAINPGNSGGALLNIKGEVIGINSNKIFGDVVEGMGYAIPISAASPIIADLMLKETKNKVAKEERGFLGISGISVTEELADDYGMPKGVYITKVYEGTPAEAVGLKKGDIITSFDGEKISSMDELYVVLEYYAKGDTVELNVMKAGVNGYREAKISITLGDKSAQ